MDDEKLICFTEEDILKPREIIIEFMDLMIRYRLTDFSGGNMALRVGKRIYSTQRYSAEKFRWKLRPDDIIVSDVEQNVLEGKKEKLSREAELHHGILKRFPKINCTIHGNTYYSPLIVSVGLKPIGITEVAKDYNIKEIPVVPEEYPMMSQEEFNFIYSAFEDLRKRDEALVAIMTYHGIIVGGKDHNEAFSLVDVVETNSKFIYERELFKKSGLFNRKPESNTNAVNQSKILQKNGFYRLDKKVNVLTLEDIENIRKINSSSEILVSKNCIVTSVAENRARELGIEIIKK